MVDFIALTAYWLLFADSSFIFLPRDASAERGDATVSRPSVCLSVRNDQVPCSNTLEFFENNFTAE